MFSGWLIGLSLEGWNRIHLTVDDLDAAIAKLKVAGSHFRNNVVQGVGGKQILLEYPSGNLIELFEPNTDTYRAPGRGPNTRET
jgi:hypothetical protein